MVNRHTEQVLRKVNQQKRKGSAEAGGASRKTAESRTGREELIRRNVQRHKIKHKKNNTLYYLLLLFILAVVGITLSLTVFFKIDTIQVVGNGSIPADSLTEATGIKIEDNLFRINTDRAEKSIISQFVTIDQATVSRKLPNTLEIKVEPAQVIAVARYNEQYYNVSRHSRVIGISKEKNIPVGIPEVVGCDYTDVELGDYLDEQNVEQNKLETLNLVLEAIEANSLKNVGYIDLTDVAFVKLYYEDRLEIKMGGLTDFAYELGCVKQLIQNQIPESDMGIIDATLHSGQYAYRAVNSITLPEGDIKSSRPATDGVAGYDLPGDEVPRESASSAAT